LDPGLVAKFDPLPAMASHRSLNTTQSSTGHSDDERVGEYGYDGSSVNDVKSATVDATKSNATLAHTPASSRSPSRDGNAPIPHTDLQVNVKGEGESCNLEDMYGQKSLPRDSPPSEIDTNDFDHDANSSMPIAIHSHHRLHHDVDTGADADEDDGVDDASSEAEEERYESEWAQFALTHKPDTQK